MLQNYLTQQEYRSLQVENLTRIAQTQPLRLWEPIPNSPQLAAFNSEADELYFGGQAGGGKTDLVMGCAIENHQHSMILRREFSQATDMIERSHEIIGSSGRYNGALHIWRLQNGARIQFLGMQQEKDWRKYTGRSRDLLAFDELPEFTKTQYQNMIGWVRSVDPDQRTRVIGTGNPPVDEEGVWVVEHWAPWLDEDHPDFPEIPGKLRWYVRIDDEDFEVDGPDPYLHNGEMLIPRSRTFIPAALKDNPYLSDSDYGSVLQALPEPLRSQLLYGDFTIARAKDAFQVIPREWLQAAFDRWAANPKPETGLSAIGCDPSRGGRDKMVIARRHANWYDHLLKYQGEEVDDGPKVAAFVIDALGNRKSTPINIDPIAIGSSPYDSLVNWEAFEVNVTGINFGSKAVDYDGKKLTDRSGKYTFRNVRAAAIWGFRESLDPETGDDLAIPYDKELKREALAHRWKPTPSGIQILSKDEVKDKIGRSPDSFDAIVLCNYTESMVGSWDDVEGLGQVEDLSSPWR